MPSAAAEVPLTNLRAATSGAGLVGTDLSLALSVNRWTRSEPLALGCALAPGSLRITPRWGGAALGDDGAGALVRDGLSIGRVDYVSGTLTLDIDEQLQALEVKFTRAAGINGPLHSDVIDVTLQNRSLSYAGYLDPLPVGGSVVVHYRSMGRWYSLSDTGAGALRGASSALGAGLVSTTSGAWQVTLGALPDVGSAIIVQWAAACQVLSWQPHAQLQALASALPPAVSGTGAGLRLPLVQRIDLSELIAQGEDVGELTLHYNVEGASNDFSLTLSAARLAMVHENLSAQYDAQRRELLLHFRRAPRTGSTLRVALRTCTAASVYEHTAQRTPDHAGRIIIPTGAPNLAPGSVQVHWQTWADVSSLGTKYTYDQIANMGVAGGWGQYVYEDLKSGQLVASLHTARDDAAGRLVNIDGKVVGTIDYATGVLTFTQPDASVRIPVPVFSRQFAGYGAVAGGSYNLNYQGLQHFTLPTIMSRAAGLVRVLASQVAADELKQLSVPAEPVTELAALAETAALLPGSLTLRAGSTVLVDDGLGRLLRLGEAVARIDYAHARVQWLNWRHLDMGGLFLLGAQMSAGQQISAAFAFRTPSAPLRAQSLSLQWIAPDGQLKSVRTDADGRLVGDGLIGLVDANTGVVRVAFGRWVAAAGHEAEPWYHTSRIRSEDGKIWRPEPIAAASLHFSATAYSYMPLAAEFIGIDPVQLPSDGRVPIFRTGTLAVLGNEQRLVIDSPQSGQLIDVGRQKLSGVRIQNAQGQSIDCGFEVDYEAGRVTLGTCSDWAAAAPITIIHRIEDMAVVSDAQITGELTFTRALSHDYPVQGSYVSSAIEAGDRFARVLPIFDQHSWDGLTFSDAPRGSPAQASYDAARCPIEVTNAGAVTQRWALQFTSATEFRIVAEQLGVIGTGKTTEDCAPMNEAAGEPYFRIRAAGWGQGWTYGNTLFIHTVGALYPFWCVRTVMPGRHTGLRYTFGLLARGDVDRPA